MRIRAICVGIVVFIFFVFGSCRKQDDFSVLKGPYLGQNPPGTEPEIFAPGLITTYYSQSYIAFLNKARVCVYSAGTEKGHETYYTYEQNRHWTTPQRAPFEELQGHPNYTTGPLGRKVYFHSGRPTHPDDTREEDNIWTIEWIGSGWAEPEVLPAPANSDYGEAYPSATADGTVYFFTWGRPETRGDDIWVSRCIDGQYQEAERLPWPINTDFIEYDPYVAPDESFLIFGSTRPGGYGNSDNYICFRKEDRSWTPPINLGRPFNSSSYDLCANGTPDGKYFFFLSGRKTDVDKGQIGKTSGEKPDEDSDLYWVDFAFINNLKNTVLTKPNAAEIINLDYRKNGIQSAINALNLLFSSQKDDTYFPPFELLSLCKDMIAENRTGDADLFFSALDDLLPKDLSIKEGYARLCAMNGHVSKGLNILEELESEDPNYHLSDSLSSLGYLFTLYPDKMEDALSVLQFTVEKFPEDPFAYYSLARVYRLLGDLAKAIANCRKALEIRPSVGDVSQLLERLIEEQKGKKADNQKKDSFPILEGPYLGQKPPGLTPEIFGPKIISTDEYHEGCSGFMKEGTVFIFSSVIPESDWKYKPTYFMQLKNSKWTSPVLVPFNNLFPYNFTVAPDGKTLYFTSLRSAENSSILLKKSNIWAVQSDNTGWLGPRMLGPEVNSIDYGENYPSVAKRGNIYYSSDHPPGLGNGDIFISEFSEGKYLAKQNLGKMINTEHSEDDPFIASDESFVIFCSNRPGGFGLYDLYISFRRKEGTWTQAKNMGPQINTTGEEARPSLTPDGKYLFFTRGNVNPDWRDIFWVDARFIAELKPAR